MFERMLQLLALIESGADRSSVLRIDTPTIASCAGRAVRESDHAANL
ncbi:hypothetical protein [Sphaerotilus sp.]|nr:hypothetical protein [Sphaerotilus sp.]